MSARLLLPLALGVDLALAAGIWSVARTPIDTAPIAAAGRGRALSPDADGDASGAAIDLRALERNHVLARPLFTDSRRAWAPPPPAPVVAPLVVAPQGATTPAAPRLVGVAIAGGRARALLAAPDGIGTLWVGIGDTAWDWQVREIAPGAVTLERDARVVPLSLHPLREGG